MTLNKFIEQLIKLQAEGHGEKQVFYCHGSSGEYGELSSAHVSNEITNMGPFDLEEGEEYVWIYAGH